MRDDYDIESRIMSATKAMGDLKTFWYNPHVDNYSKYLIFRYILMNLIILGCEAWSCCATLKSKLEVFIHFHSIQMFKMSMFQVKDDHIHRSDIQEMLCIIPSVENMITSRQLLFIGCVIWYPSYDRPEKGFWNQVAIIQVHNKNVAHNITTKILLWVTFFFYYKYYKKCILTLGVEIWGIGSMRLARKDIGTSLFGVYYTWEVDYHPVLKLVTYGGKVVGTELGWILLHIQLLHHSGGTNLLLLHRHHIK